MLQVNSLVINASEATEQSRAAAGAGLSFDSAQPVLLPRATVLCRVGHQCVKGVRVPDVDNYMSPWWTHEAVFSKVLSLGQADPSWAVRVAMAIAEEWGGDCRLQMRVVLAEPLYAWSGKGRVISGGRNARAVAASNPRAYWFPDASVTQLFIPGLNFMPRGRPGALWATAFTQRQSTPLLIAGRQLDLSTGKPFAGKSSLPPGRRHGSV